MTGGPTLTVACTVNGEVTTLTGHPMMRLLDALRLHLHLTGTKEGCGEGECGACAVLVDRALVNSCLMPLLHADGVDITTIEGLADGDRLHPVQAAFADSGAAQCGICTPGMVLASVALLERHPQPDDAEIREGLAGNLCRCTGYVRIFDAVRQAARLAREDRLPPDRLRHRERK
jgi:carbon-monoxide dehydrogenase small subunit